MFYIISLHAKLSAKNLATATRDIQYTWNSTANYILFPVYPKSRRYIFKLGNKTEYFLIKAHRASSYNGKIKCSDIETNLCRDIS